MQPRPEEVRAWIVTYLADVLDLDPARIDGSQPFTSYGLDSTDAVVMAGVFEEQFKVEVDPLLFLRNPTLDALMADLKASGIVA